MLRPGSTAQVYLYADPVDMRKSIDGLSALVEAELDLSPFAEAIFVFCNRGRDKVKLLCWERNGFIVWYKRLEKQRFHWNRSSEGVVSLDGQALNRLLDGLDIWRQKPHETLHFDSVLQAWFGTISAMNSALETLPDDPLELKKIIVDRDQTIDHLRVRIDAFEEFIRLLRSLCVARFGEIEIQKNGI